MAEVGLTAPAVSSPPSSASPSSSAGASNRSSLSFRLCLWPPTQITRDAVLRRLTEIISSPSTLSNRFGTLSFPEANDVARCVESEAFAAAETFFASNSGDEEGMETLQIYSREISRRMLDAAKARTSG